MKLVPTSSVLVPALLVALSPLLASPASATPAEAAPFLAEASRLLVQGSYSDAARAFGEALEHDPNYVTHYKRATAYLSLGRNAQALDDFDSILKLNPSFSKAHLEKAKLYAKDGTFHPARASLQSYLKANPADETATAMLTSVKTAEAALEATRKASKKRKLDECIASATTVLETSPNSVDARELRAECHLAKGDIEDGVGDLTRLAALNPSSPELAIRVASLSFLLQESGGTLPQLKQCLHYDPDSPSCKKAFKQFKALAKAITQTNNFLSSNNSWRPLLKVLIPLLTSFDEAIDAYAQYLPPDAKVKSEPRRRLWAGACKAYVQIDQINKAMPYCEETLKMSPEDMDALVGKGEKLMKDESWEEAVRVLNQAFELSGRSSQDISNRLQKAQRLLKQSKAKDYYKVIGVSRDADDKTIKRAYRQAAKKAHPDKGGSEAKMAALNEAWEVLSKPELKQRFDNGDDPNDQSSGGGGHPGHGSPFQHHGGDPYQHFFHQQGGGGSHQSFKFQW